MLLTTIQSVDPAANAFDAPSSTDISATFDQDVVAGSATADNFVVHSSFAGRLTGAATTVSAAGPVITHNPAANFAPGDTIQVTATSNITTAGGAANSRVWEFRTEVTGGSGQFSDSGQVFPNGVGAQLAVGDIDGDGDQDVVSGGQAIWLNDGAGAFTDSGQTIATGGEAKLADIDGDGDLDLVGTTTVLTNDGSGVFADSGQNLLGGPTVEVGDLDGDGDLDAVTGVTYGPNRVWLNNGNGQFTNTGQGLGTATSHGLTLADFDSDGDLDIFSANNGPVNRVWFNDGNAVFTDSGQMLGGFSPSFEAEHGDVDGDGDIDVFVGNDDSNLGARLWLNDGSGQFVNSGQSIATAAGAPRIRAPRLGDLDGDGDLDLFAINVRAPSEVWINDGAGVFSDSGQRINFVPFDSRRIDNAALADFDGDGDLDIWEQGIFPGGSKVWINQNLEPSVSLSIDNASVAEAAGTATVTATLDAAHTSEVTIDLGLSGTATIDDDYTISATQIVIPVGATSGTVSITANQDTVDEPDETVIVDITAATNAQEAGAQQVTATIVDDDEPIPVPDVTLVVDNAAIPEAGGVATFTANLSVATTVPVTIDFAVSGTAAGSDYTVSATQIVVAPGATSGSITVTAVQDPDDEPDETVVIDIAGVTGGTESGVQQQTTTITDDDEPPVPDVTIAVDDVDIAEAAGVATFTLTLSEVTTVPVVVDLGITGTADAADFTASATQVTIAPGATSGALVIAAVQDEVNEPDETVIVDITSVTGGNESGEQQATTTILDDDVPPTFVVTSLTASDSSFHIELNNALDGGDLNLYDTQNAAMGAADVVVTGATSGPIAGSLVVGDSSVTFVKSGGPFAADSYTVTLRSATDGFEDTSGGLLDGNSDGTPGDDYTSQFTVDAAPAGARTVSIPDFVRGPGQEVNLPADGTTGIPIAISDGTDVRAVDLRISYDPALLEITGATAAPGGTVVVNTATPGLAILVYFSTTPLPAGESTFINLLANVPAENGSANYGSQQLLDVNSVVVGDGNDNEFPVLVDDGFHFATYFADVSGNGRINASDAAQVARFAALIDSGFAASLTTDPILVGDISGNGRINAADASRVAQFAALIPVPEIPPVPAGGLSSGVVVPGQLRSPFDAEGEEDNPAAIDAGGGFLVVESFMSRDSQENDHARNVDAVLEDDQFSVELECLNCGLE